jgi:hypothetical protein
MGSVVESDNLTHFSVKIFFSKFIILNPLYFIIKIAAHHSPVNLSLSFTDILICFGPAKYYLVNSEKYSQIYLLL